MYKSPAVFNKRLLLHRLLLLKLVLAQKESRSFLYIRQSFEIKYCTNFCSGKKLIAHHKFHFCSYGKKTAAVKATSNLMSGKIK